MAKEKKEEQEQSNIAQKSDVRVRIISSIDYPEHIKINGQSVIVSPRAKDLECFESEVELPLPKGIRYIEVK